MLLPCQINTTTTANTKILISLLSLFPFSFLDESPTCKLCIISQPGICTSLSLFSSPKTEKTVQISSRLIKPEPHRDSGRFLRNRHSHLWWDQTALSSEVRWFCSIFAAFYRFKNVPSGKRQNPHFPSFWGDASGRIPQLVRPKIPPGFLDSRFPRNSSIPVDSNVWPSDHAGEFLNHPSLTT